MDFGTAVILGLLVIAVVLLLQHYGPNARKLQKLETELAQLLAAHNANVARLDANIATQDANVATYDKSFALIEEGFKKVWEGFDRKHAEIDSLTKRIKWLEAGKVYPYNLPPLPQTNQ